MVANRRLWNWTKLSERGAIQFRTSRVVKHYPQIQVGDLVVGYDASPRREIVTIGRISQVFSPISPNEPAFEVIPHHNIARRITWAVLHADPVLGRSEPIRCRNQGILFRLTTDEASYLLQSLRLAPDSSLRQSD